MPDAQEFDADATFDTSADIDGDSSAQAGATESTSSEPVPDALLQAEDEPDLAAIAADEAGEQLGDGEREGEGLATAPAPIGLADHDPLVATSIELARHALGEITDAGDVADFVGLVDEGDGLYAARFATTIAGYPGWFWNVSMVRLEGDEVPSILETELLPGDDALLAPAWVPWAERLAQYEAEHAASNNSSEPGGEDERADGEMASDADGPQARTSRAEAGGRARPLARRERRRVRIRRDGEAAPAADADADAETAESRVAAVDDDGFVIDPDIREFADDMDDVLDGVEFEDDDPVEVRSSDDPVESVEASPAVPDEH